MEAVEQIVDSQKVELKNTIRYGKVPALDTKIILYYTIQHEGGCHIDFRQMSRQTTANNCKTAFSLYMSSRARYSFQFH